MSMRSRRTTDLRFCTRFITIISAILFSLLVINWVLLRIVLWMIVFPMEAIVVFSEMFRVYVVMTI